MRVVAAQHKQKRQPAFGTGCRFSAPYGAMTQSFRGSEEGSDTASTERALRFRCRT